VDEEDTDVLMKRVHLSEGPQRIRVGDAIIHIQKVGENRVTFMIDAPKNVEVEALDRPTTKPIEDLPPYVV